MGAIIPPTISGTPGLAAALANGDWTNITTNPGNMTGQNAQSTYYSQTTRNLVTVPQGMEIEEIIVAYGNHGQVGSPWTPNSNPITIKGSVFSVPSTGLGNNTAGVGPIGYLQFGSGEIQIVGRGKLALSKPFKLHLKAGNQFYIHSYADSLCPAAPNAPTATGNTSSGSSFGSGNTYVVGVTYVFPSGMESAGSQASSTITIGSTGNVIVVTGPSDPLNGAIGWRPWISQQGQLTGSMYNTSQRCIPFGTTAIIKNGPNITGGSGMEIITSNANAGLLYIPIGWYPAGGTLASQAGASGSGEGAISNADYTDGQYGIGTSFGGGGTWGPIAILGRARTGITRSVGTGGDSINQATFDSGYNNGSGNGGWQMRACLGQINNRKFDPTIITTMGIGHMGIGGESMANFASSNGNTRSEVLRQLYTSIWLNYGTNDLGTTVVTLISNALIVAARFTAFNKPLFLSELAPRGGTTDGYQILANQTLSVGATSEARRRSYNNWVSDNTASVSFSEANMFRSFTGSVAPTYNVYGGGDGSIKNFYSKYIFQTGTETVTRAGNACTYNASPSGQNQYSYLGTATINGVTFLEGISFGTAPNNGDAIAITATKPAGFRTNTLCDWISGPSAIEIDSNGTQVMNGGFVKVAGAPLTATRSMSSSPTSTTFTDSGAGVTLDQYAGYCVYIVSDSGTPTAVGQNGSISNNTAAGVFTIANWSGSVTPSSSATYFIYDAYMIGNGPHPSTGGHMLMAQNVSLSLFV